MDLELLDVTRPFKESANNELPALVMKYLQQAGYTGVTEDELRPVFEFDDPLSFLLDLVNAINAKLDAVMGMVGSFGSITAGFMSLFGLSSSRVEQDALTPARYPEIPAVATNFSSPVDQDTSNNSMGENYPNTHGAISSKSDHYKVDTDTGLVEFVHHSGTMIRVDDSGNVTIQAAGAVKQIVGDSLTINCAGGIDIVSAKGIFLHGMEVEVKSESSYKLDAMEIEEKGTSMRIDVPSVEATSSEIKAPSAMLEVGMTGKFGALVSAPGFATA